MSRPVVIVNPAAGSAPSANDLEDRLGFLGEPWIRATREAGDARRMAERAVRDRAPIVVVVGGDGTLNEVVNGLASDFSACTVGIVPAGTGNDAARSLGVPLEVDAAIQRLADEETTRVDIVEVEHDGAHSFALNAATGGFGGTVNERMTDEVRDLWGPLAYVRAAGEVASEPPAYDLVVSLDGQRGERHRVISLVVANGPLAAGGVPIAPGARMNDGRLAVHAVLEVGGVERLAIATALLRGVVPEHEAYRSWACEGVTVRSDAGFPVSVDGELVEARRMRYAVRPGALRIVGATPSD